MRVDLSFECGLLCVPGVDSGVPGLAVTPAVRWLSEEAPPQHLSGWVLTHLDTGRALLDDWRFEIVASAQACARELGKLVDFTLPQDDLKVLGRQEKLMRRVREVVERHARDLAADDDWPQEFPA